MPEANTTEKETPRASIAEIVKALRGLPPGPLARLRRMDCSGAGEMDYWWLATALHLTRGETDMQLIRLLALLTPRGEVHARPFIHRAERPLGKVLAEAGYSETRLARFMALPFSRRPPALERMVRFIAGKMGDGVNCGDIDALLSRDDVWPLRRLADSYYHAIEQKSFENKDIAS